MSLGLSGEDHLSLHGIPKSRREAKRFSPHSMNRYQAKNGKKSLNQLTKSQRLIAILKMKKVMNLLNFL